jgi:predicted metal-dependent peptidase
MDEKFLDKVTLARRLLLKDYPEFGMTSLNLRILPDPDCPVGWTDGTSIGFNPTWVANNEVNYIKTLWAHECLHIMLLHPFRMGDRDHNLWNQAADYVINSMTREADLPIIPNGLYNYYWRDKTTEEIFNLLKENLGKENQGKPKPGKNPGSAGDILGEVRPAAGTPTELKKQEGEQNIRNRISIQTAKMWGRLPGSILKIIQDLVEPKVSAAEILRNYMDNLIRDDYSWRRLDSQYMQRDLLVPTLWGETIRELVVVTDSSGSVSNEDLTQFNAIFNDCLAELPSTTVYWMDCDTKVQTVKEYQSREGKIKLEVKGRGGTDFRPPFIKVEELGLTPSVLIYLTDLECNQFPTEAPDYPVLWIKVHRRSQAGTPPFGGVIELPE